MRSAWRWTFALAGTTALLAGCGSTTDVAAVQPAANADVPAPDAGDGGSGGEGASGASGGEGAAARGAQDSQRNGLERRFGPLVRVRFEAPGVAL